MEKAASLGQARQRFSTLIIIIISIIIIIISSIITSVTVFDGVLLCALVT